MSSPGEMPPAREGHHRIYYTNHDEKEYRRYVLRTVIKSMMEDFPEQTKEVLSEFHT